MEAASVAVKRKTKRPSGFSAERRLGAAMMAPSLIVMALVAAFPIGYAIWLSLNEYSVRVDGPVALRRYRQLHRGAGGDTSGEFWDAFRVTFIFTGISVSIELVLGIAFALAMHQAFKGRAILRATVLVPWAVLTFGTGLLWRSIFEPNLGFVPSTLSALGLPGGDVLWYGEDGWAMATLIFADVWKTAPFMALLLLAGLQVIPEDVYDAAKVDGATAWQRFRRITLPLLRPAILVALLFRTLDALRVFDLPFALTHGVQRHHHAVTARLQRADQEPARGGGVGARRAHVRDRDGGVVPLHPLRRREHPRDGGGDVTAAAATATRSSGGSKRRAERRNRILLWVAVVAIMLFCLFPFYWLVNTSLKTGPDLSSADIFPPNPTLDNYASIFEDSNFTTALRNSVIVAGVTTVLALAIGSFAGYALARLRFRGKYVLLAIILSVTTFPPIAIAAPLFKFWTDLDIYDTLYGLIPPFLAFTLPLTIYVLASFFREIPRDLTEAALVDGATHFQAFRKVVLPLAAPGLVTAGLLSFIWAWNEFLLAITLTSSPDARPVPPALAFFTGSQEFEVPLGTITAALVVVTVPLVILVLIFQQRIVAGLTAGAVKG